MTVSLQVQTLGRAYLETEQVKRHTNVLQRRTGSPYQYRVFSEYLVQGIFRVFEWLRCPHPLLTAFIGTRLLQNFLIFLLAALYYYKLGFPVFHTLLALSFLFWGMSHAFYNSDLSFNTYSDIICYLAAGLLILHERPVWIIPLTAIAALNRETSGLIPFLLLAEYWRIHRQEKKLHPSFFPTEPEKTLVIAGIALLVYATIFIGLRLVLGFRPLVLPPGNYRPGIEIFLYNVCRVQTWIHLFATVGILPALALLSFRRWPAVLQYFFWILVPAWLSIHILASLLAETRLILTPYALIFVPGAVWGASHHE